MGDITKQPDFDVPGNTDDVAWIYDQIILQEDAESLPNDRESLRDLIDQGLIEVVVSFALIGASIIFGLLVWFV